MDREEMKALLRDFMQKAQEDYEADAALLAHARELVNREVQWNHRFGVASILDDLVEIHERRLSRAGEALQVLPRLFEGFL